jgi:hypothetical protein
MPVERQSRACMWVSRETLRAGKHRRSYLEEGTVLHGVSESISPHPGLLHHRRTLLATLVCVKKPDWCMKTSASKLWRNQDLLQHRVAASCN